MTQQQAIQLFEQRKVRTAWDSDAEKWYFSIVDVVAVLTNSDYQTARKYWKVLKGRMIKEGNQLVTNCYQLKMMSTDGKNPLGMAESADVARRGGKSARTAREAAEREIGQSIVSPENAKSLTSSEQPKQLEIL